MRSQQTAFHEFHLHLHDLDSACTLIICSFMETFKSDLSNLHDADSICTLQFQTSFGDIHVTMIE